ncbi:hypothetical protein ACT4W4_12660 [Acinetobacter baumannii]
MTDLNNPETIEIHGLRTITKLCHFGADNNMEGCTFTEIVERLFAELEKAKAQAVPDGWAIVPQELPLNMALKIAKERILEQPPVKDPVLNEILEKAHKENIQSEQCRLMRDYKEMVKRLSESGAEG